MYSSVIFIYFFLINFGLKTVEISFFPTLAIPIIFSASKNKDEEDFGKNMNIWIGFCSNVDFINWYATSEFFSSKNIPASSNIQSGEGLISCRDRIKQIEMSETCPPLSAVKDFNWSLDVAAFISIPRFSKFPVSLREQYDFT